MTPISMFTAAGNKLLDALKALGDIPQDFSVDRLFLPGVTQVAD